MNYLNKIGLGEFLAQHPSLRFKCTDGEKIILEGVFGINAQIQGDDHIEDSYHLRITFTKNFPNDLPKVFEIGGRIPDDDNHHINPDEKSLCLGSTLKLKLMLSQQPTIVYFGNNILTPFLYSISYKLKHGTFPYGELQHGEAGLIQDYEQIFGVKGKQSVMLVLKALGIRKRLANRLPCACGCGKALRKCAFRFFLNSFRGKIKRRWFIAHLQNDFKKIEPALTKKKLNKKFTTAKHTKFSKI